MSGRDVVGIRALGGKDGGCDSARGAQLWEKKKDVSGNKHRGSRCLALSRYTPTRSGSLSTANRGPWDILDTWNKVNGKCIEDRSGSYECGPVNGLSLYK
ncbi:hypothetical protein PG993_015040 [Apiospora rasikravindrae]|uniref:Uncharacterized protein n=1 Tax=Apiospora rasikravindrae TaxID=990691 RepID=A0ABR1RQL0_9PEZI